VDDDVWERMMQGKEKAAELFAKAKISGFDFDLNLMLREGKGPTTKNIEEHYAKYIQNLGVDPKKETEKPTQDDKSGTKTKMKRGRVAEKELTIFNPVGQNTLADHKIHYQIEGKDYEMNYSNAFNEI